MGNVHFTSMLHAEDLYPFEKWTPSWVFVKDFDRRCRTVTVQHNPLFVSFNKVVHKLELKKTDIWLLGGQKILFVLVTSGCLHCTKVRWAFWIYFCQKWGILQIKMDERWEHIKINLKYFQIQKWISRTFTLEKFSCFLPELCFLNCLKKYFLWFVLTSVRNVSLLKKFIWKPLEGLFTHYQKMVLFIMLLLTVLEILVFVVKEFC